MWNNLSPLIYLIVFDHFTILNWCTRFRDNDYIKQNVYSLPSPRFSTILAHVVHKHLRKQYHTNITPTTALFFTKTGKKYRTVSWRVSVAIIAERTLNVDFFFIPEKTFLIVIFEFDRRSWCATTLKEICVTVNRYWKTMDPLCPLGSLPENLLQTEWYIIL